MNIKNMNGIDTIKLREIVKRGGGVIVSAKDVDIMTLRDLCRFAKASGAHVVIRDASKLGSIDCWEMARLCPGSVDFDFTSYSAD